MMMKLQNLLMHFAAITLFIWLAILPQPTAAQSVDLATADLPDRVRLEGLLQVNQLLNRCASAALTIQLSYYDEFDANYTQMINRLNPYGGDVSVRIEEMAQVAEEFGLNAIVRRGGTIDMLRRLVAAGFPVLIENVYYDGPNGWQDWMSHNRVLVGYDDPTQTMYFFDPLLGNGPDGRGRPMSYTDVDERWRPFNRDYLVVYTDEEEDRLKAVLGDHWDEEFSARFTLIQAQSEIDGPSSDSFALFNRGWAQLQLGMVEEAAESFDQARALGLPWRMFWYEFGPFEAYLQLGRYDDVINLVYSVIQTTDGVEEMYYYIGRAFEGKGDIQRAIANYEAALYRNRYFTEASQRLADLQTGG